MTSAALAGAANDQTYCVCFLGRDPASQMPHALDVARCLAERGTVVCWEAAAEAVARDAGLRNVRGGNRHLLSAV